MSDAKKRTSEFNIAYMLTHFPGISETFIVREIIELKKQGYNVSIYALKKPKDNVLERTLCDRELLSHCSYAKPSKFMKHTVINIKSLASHPIKYLSSFRIFYSKLFHMEPIRYFRSLYHFFCGIGFSEQIRKKGIRHIHSHFATGSSMALAAATFLGVKYSFTAHASGDIFCNPILLEEKVDCANFVIAVCEYSKKYLDSVTNYQYSDKIYRMYNGLTLAEYDKYVRKRTSSLQIEKSSSNNKIDIISIGRLVSCKGFPTLIEACRLLKKRGYKICCEIIGDGPERYNLLKLIRQSQLDDTVVIKGYYSLGEVYKALEKADIFALLSEIHMNGYRDGFPTVILEAMLMSLPVVSTWISGIPEMVINGKTGILIHERDSVSAAEAIEILINNIELRKQLGKKGQEKVLESFLLEKNIGLLVECLGKSTRKG